jgi:hypothetical protein
MSSKLERSDFPHDSLDPLRAFGLHGYRLVRYAMSARQSFDYNATYLVELFREGRCPLKDLFDPWKSFVESCRRMVQDLLNTENELPTVILWLNLLVRYLLRLDLVLSIK